MLKAARTYQKRLRRARELLKLQWKVPSLAEALRIAMRGGDPFVPQGPTIEPGIRLHVGAGQKILAGYENLDGYRNDERVAAFPTRATNIARAEALDEFYEPESVSEIRCHHVFEHISLLDVDRTLRAWNRILKPGGLLWLEVPDFAGCAKRILELQDEEAKELYFRHLFGSQVGPGEYHLNGLTTERLMYLLTNYGFKVHVAYIEWTLREPSKPTFLYPSNPPLPDITVKATRVGPPKPELDQAEWTHIAFRKLVPNPALVSRQAGETPTDLDDIVQFNPRRRAHWVADVAKSLPPGSRVLDLGAGECQYRPLFSHCSYEAQDFAQYQGQAEGLLRETWDYGHLDYVCDATAIPAADETFDAILCTEVLEHVPEPVAVLREMARLLKVGGRAFISAPLGSGLHQQPFHYYGGFTPHFYQHFLGKLGFEVLSIEPNKRFFHLLMQELHRASQIVRDRLPVTNPELVRWFLAQATEDRITRALAILDDEVPVEEFTAGYHVHAVKRSQAHS